MSADRAFVHALTLAAIAGASVPALADRGSNEDVTARLVERGDLSEAQANVLVKTVSKRMKRAALRPDGGDRVRVAMARAIGKPRATRQRDPQLQRRLRAGLDVWALERLFAPGPDGAVLCERGFKLTSNLCDALADAASDPKLADHAAGGTHSAVQRPTRATQARAEVKSAEAEPTEEEYVPTARELAAERRALLAEQKREKRLAAREARREAAEHRREQAEERARQKRERIEAAQLKRQQLAEARAERKREQLETVKRKREAIAAARAERKREQLEAVKRKREAIAAARAERERERQEAIQRQRDEVERRKREQREAVERERARVEIARRKAEYDRQRAAYMDRQRDQLAARKARVVASVAGEKVQRGPQSRLEAELVGYQPDADANADGGNKGKARPNARAQSPAGLDMVDALVAEPSAKPKKPTDDH